MPRGLFLQKMGVNMEVLRHLKDFMKENKWQYIIGVIVLVIVDILQLITPRIIGNVVDSIGSGTISNGQVLYYALLIMIIACFIAFFRYMWRIKIIGSSRVLEFWMRSKIFKHLEGLSKNFFNYRKTGDLMAHATNDIQAVRMAFGPGVIMLTDSIFLTIATIGVMSTSISPTLTLLALIPLPILAIIVTFLGQKIQKRYKLVQESFSNMSDRTQESFTGIRVIKSYVQEEEELLRFSNASEEYVFHNMKLVRIFGFMFPMIGFIVAISFLVALYIGGNMVIEGRISLGELVAFITYLGMLTWPMMAIGWVINVIQRGLASLKRINEILDAKPEVVDKEGVLPIENLNELAMHISIKNLSFKYPKIETYALRNIDLDIKPGETLAVVGKTGSGKSTLASLFLRNYNIEEGEISIGGVNVEKIPIKTLRKATGYVPQEAFLFSTTISQNIAFSDPNLPFEKIENAAKTASVYDDIMSFPQKFQTIVGEKGVTLSGGQKQRVSISRALIKDPSILILDDCLSAVDTKTEEAILEHLQDVMKDRTSIIISHRISAIKNADEIIFMEDGEIVERGKHIELLRLGGRYSDLYKKQLLEEKLEEEV